MKTVIKYSELRSDLLNLYCKVNKPSLENLYVKFAQDFDQSFFTWLRKNNAVANSLNNPSVYGALLTLLFLREKVGGYADISMSQLIQNITPFKKHLANIPTIITFSTLLNSEARDILIPFGDIINAVAGRLSLPAGQEAPDPSPVLNDLLKMQELFREGGVEENQVNELQNKRVRETLDQRKINMFIYLLRRFSSDIASAADRNDMNELAGAIRSGILASPDQLSKYIEFPSLDVSTVQEVKGIVSYIKKNLRSYHQNKVYENIKSRLFSFVGIVAPQDIEQYYGVPEEAPDFSKYMDPSQDVKNLYLEGPPVKTLKMDDAQWLNPELIMDIGLVLYSFHKES